MTEFIRQELRNARFERVDLSDVELNGWLDGPLSVNGVDVGPLVDAELNRPLPRPRQHAPRHGRRLP